MQNMERVRVSGVNRPNGRWMGWISESGEPCPPSVSVVEDHLVAREAAHRMRAGEYLLWEGDVRQGRRLLRAVAKRLAPRHRPLPESLAARWHQARRTTKERAEVLGRLLVCVEPDGTLALPRAPDTRQAVRWAWGVAEHPRLVSLKTLDGALGAAGWRRTGIEVEGLRGRITPHYGVFSPTRQAYVSLLDAMGDVTGLRLLDVGCGTGVLSFVLLQRGLKQAVGTDVEERAVACARDNAASLGLQRRFDAHQADLFLPGERFDRILFNAPWMPGLPATRLDKALFDEGGQTLIRWLSGLEDHLCPDGRAALIISDLPERIGLRDEGELLRWIADAGLKVRSTHETAARHGKAHDTTDPLHRARSTERVALFDLSPR